MEMQQGEGSRSYGTVDGKCLHVLCLVRAPLLSLTFAIVTSLEILNVFQRCATGELVAKTG